MTLYCKDKKYNILKKIELVENLTAAVDKIIKN